MATKETWRNSKGKELLRAEIVAGTVKKGDNPDVVYKKNPEYAKWPLTNFRTNMKNLIKAIEAESSGTGKKKKKEKWGTSEAKHLLRTSIIAGVVKRGDDPEEVHKSDPEYKKWPIANFKTNMKNLIEAVGLDWKRMADDCKSYGHDAALIQQYRRSNPISDQEPWHKSAAKKLLEHDMDSNKHVEMKPMELYHSRIEYRAFPLDVFRNHIYQEKFKRANKGSRLAKKKKRFPAAREISEDVGKALVGIL